MCLQTLPQRDPGTTSPGEHAGAVLFPPSRPMQGAECSTPLSPGLCTHGEVAPSLSLRSSSIKRGDGCSDGTSLPSSQTGHRAVAAPPSLPLFFHFFNFWGFFTVAGLFSSLRHHLAHHSGRPHRPRLAPVVCQGVPAEGQNRIQWCPCRRSC